MKTQDVNTPKLHHPKLEAIIKQNLDIFDYNENFIEKVNEDIKAIENFLRSKAVVTEWTLNDWYKLYCECQIPDELNIFDGKQNIEVVLWKEDEGDRSPKLAWCRALMINNEFDSPSQHLFEIEQLAHLSSAPIFVRTKLYKQLPFLLTNLTSKIAENIGYYESRTYQSNIPF